MKNILSTLLPVTAGLALLAACGPTAAPTTPTVTPAPGLGALYAITFQGVTDKAPIVKASSVGQHLGTQGLVAGPATLTVSSAPIATSAFTDPATRTRHIQATFQVTNTTAATLDNLVFLPTVTTDTDVDPGNNGAPPTIPGTPFQSVQYFDGSDAAARATTLAPERARLLDAATGTSSDDPGSNPFLTGLDTTGITPTPPAGLSAAVQNQGWQVSPSLAPGQSTTVTFSVNEQGIDLSNPKANPYNFTLLVTAAQDDPSTTDSGTAVNPGSIRGTLNDSAVFGGSLRLVNDVASPRTQFGVQTTVMTSGAVNFPVTEVPPYADLTAALLPAGNLCKYSGTVPYSSVSFAVYTGLLASSADGDPVATVQETIVSHAKVNGAIVARVYNPSIEMVLQAKVSCSNRPFTIDYDLHLKHGWNAIEVSGTNGAQVMKDLDPLARSVLTFKRRPPGVTATLTDTSIITLHPGERVTRSAHFLQVGAYSGTVTLGTNVPGVTVEPSTITLGRLGTQALSTPITFVAAPNAPAHTRYTFTDALTISDTGGTVLGSTPISVDLSVPSVNASLNSSSVTLIQGETRSVSVDASGYNGLNGPVTFALTGLPSGVTAVPQTVQVNGYPPVTVNIPVTAAADAALGSVTITLTTDRQNIGSSTTATLNIAPTRTALPNLSIDMALPAKKGLWIKSSSSYDNNGYGYTLRRFVNGVEQTSLRLDDRYTLLSSPTGDLIASDFSTYGNAGPTTVKVIHDDGTSDDASLPSSTGWRAENASADNQGRVWFLSGPPSYVSTPRGLYRYEPNGGTITTVVEPGVLPTDSRLFVSNDGGTLIVRSVDSGKTFRVDTTTGKASELSVLFPSSYGASTAVADDGSFWINVYGTVQRWSAAAGAVTVDALNGATLTGFDRQNPDVLWAMKNGTTVLKYTVSTGTVRATVLTSEYFASDSLYLAPNGGVEILYRDSYTYVNSQGHLD